MSPSRRRIPSRPIGALGRVPAKHPTRKRPWSAARPDRGQVARTSSSGPPSGSNKGGASEFKVGESKQGPYRSVHGAPDSSLGRETSIFLGERISCEASL